MKKLTIVLLIAVLAVSFAFAAFSGNANIQFNADLDNKDFGFANGTSFSFTFNLVTEEVKIAEGEGIHAEISAKADLIAATTHKTGEDIALVVNTTSDKAGYGAVVSISKAQIVGSNWYVSILGAASGFDYAKASYIATYNKAVRDAWGFQRATTWQASSFAASYAKAPGVTVGYDGYVASVGFYRDHEKGTKASATFQTKEFKFSDDAIGVQAGVEASKKEGKEINTGLSVKGSVAIQDITVKVAADFALQNLRSGDENSKPYFAFDARADFAYDFITANVYAFVGDKDGKASLAEDYGMTATGKFYGLYLEAGADADLNAFDLPLAVGVSAANIIDKQEDVQGAAAGIGLSAYAEYAQDAITAGAAFDFNTASKDWSANIYGAYAAEKFTAGANVALGGAEEFDTLSLGAFIESDALIQGATVGANYGLSNNVAMNYGGSYATANGYNTNNFVADPAAIGTVGAYCIIRF